MSFFDSAVANAIGLLPRSLVQRVAARYVAGALASDAIACTRRLNAEGYPATLDVLGESARNVAEVHAAENAYLALLSELAAERVVTDLSVKPTALGLLLDPRLCEAAISRIASRARAANCTVCLDMEDSRCTQLEVDLFLRLRTAGAPVALALQAYLTRTRDDVMLLAEGGNPLRICKGIYQEPERLLIRGARQDRRLINPHFLEAARICFKAGSFVSIATHDEALIQSVLNLAHQLGIDRSRFELQMLLGVCEPLRDSLRDRGYTVRIYVPFGNDWYAYCTRRMQENPRLAGQVARACLWR
nr:proline dehydrogenase family protein [uncultured Caldimonas sp.]